MLNQALVSLTLFCLLLFVMPLTIFNLVQCDRSAPCWAWVGVGDVCCLFFTGPITPRTPVAAATASGESSSFGGADGGGDNGGGGGGGGGGGDTGDGKANAGHPEAL